MKQKIIVGVLAMMCLAMFFQPVWAAPESAEIKTTEAVAVPTQEELVLSMTQFMNSLPRFYISGNASYDKVYADNEKIMYSFDFDYYVQRPAEFQLNIEGDLQNKQLLFNGKTITVYDEDKGVYAVIETPSTIEAALDQAFQEYGLSFQLLDVARSDFGKNLLKDVIKSAYVGMSKVGDIPCHHVVFTKKDRSIQLWIEAGDKPFLRKVVVNFKENPAIPSWNLEITDWNLEPVLPEGWTTFVAKPGMKQIPFLQQSKQQTDK